MAKRFLSTKIRTISYYIKDLLEYALLSSYFPDNPRML